jgi:hypothetical protein
MEKIMETIALFNNLSLSQDYYNKNMTEHQTEFCTEKERKNLTNPKTMTNILTKIIINNEEKLQIKTSILQKLPFYAMDVLLECNYCDIDHPLFIEYIFAKWEECIVPLEETKKRHIAFLQNNIEYLNRYLEILKNIEQHNNFNNQLVSDATKYEEKIHNLSIQLNVDRGKETEAIKKSNNRINSLLEKIASNVIETNQNGEIINFANEANKLLYQAIVEKLYSTTRQQIAQCNENLRFLDRTNSISILYSKKENKLDTYLYAKQLPLKIQTNEKKTIGYENSVDIIKYEIAERNILPNISQKWAKLCENQNATIYNQIVMKNQGLIDLALLLKNKVAKVYISNWLNNNNREKLTDTFQHFATLCQNTSNEVVEYVLNYSQNKIANIQALQIENENLNAEYKESNNRNLLSRITANKMMITNYKNGQKITDLKLLYNWDVLCSNPNPQIISLLRNNIEYCKKYFSKLCENKNAVDLIFTIIQSDETIKQIMYKYTKNERDFNNQYLYNNEMYFAKRIWTGISKNPSLYQFITSPENKQYLEPESLAENTNILVSYFAFEHFYEDLKETLDGRYLGMKLSLQMLKNHISFDFNEGI